jgi:hypothetical protein
MKMGAMYIRQPGFRQPDVLSDGADRKKTGLAPRGTSPVVNHRYYRCYQRSTVQPPQPQPEEAAQPQSAEAPQPVETWTCTSLGTILQT